MKIVVNKNKFLLMILSVMPFIDMLLGAAINGGDERFLSLIGQFYRAGIFIYLFYLLYSGKVKYREVYLLLFSCIVLTNSILNAFRYTSSIGDNISMTMKFLLPIWLLSTLIKRKINYYSLNILFEYFSFVYPLSLIIPKLLNIGYEHYEHNSGYKGFYSGTNEINIILVVLFIYCFGKMYEHWNLKNIFYVIINLIALLLIGSKTSLMIMPIVVICFLLKGKNIVKKIKYLIAILGVSILGGGVIYYLIRDRIKRMLERLNYFYTKDVKSFYDFISFLLSKRNLRIKISFDYWYNKQGVLNFLFGVGKSAKCPTTKNIDYRSPFSLIEMDYFDGLLWFGVIAISVAFGIYFHILWKTRKQSALFTQRLACFVMLAFSLTAGHVMFSASSGIILALVAYNIIVSSQEK